MENNPKTNKRVHLGVLFGTILNTCQYSIWDGVVRYAESNDINLTAFFCSYYTTASNYVTHYETCLDNINKCESLDGIILMSSSIMTSFSQKGPLGSTETDNVIMKCIERLPKRLPIVSVGSLLPGIPSVMVDSVKGMYDVVDHLIKHHGKRKIAFVKGPEEHWEVTKRFEGYKKALEENGIDFDESYVLPGNFLQECGSAVVEEMLDKRRLEVDAIAACNDAMAVGILKELKSRSIRVPANVAVTGFDDDSISQEIIPPLTTSRQEFFSQGVKSAEIVCKMIDKQAVEDSNFLTPTLVIRQSCNCLERKLNDSDLRGIAAKLDTYSSYAERMAIPLFPNDVPPQLISMWITQLIGLMKETPFSGRKFLYRLYGILGEYNLYTKRDEAWIDMLHALLSGVLIYRDEFDDMQQVVSALVSAVTIVHDIRFIDLHSQHNETGYFRAAISRVANSLISAFDYDSLADELFQSFPRLHIETALICLFGAQVTSDEPNADRSLCTIIGFDADKKYFIDTPKDKLLPFDYTSIPGFNFDSKRRTLLFFPLFFGDEDLGVVILSCDRRVPMDEYEGLRIGIATAVKGATLLSKVRALTIVDELTGLLNRRGFFQQVNTRLRQAKRESGVATFILFADLDGLKTINDTYGHKEGDEAIVAFSQALRRVLREVDIIGRVGGDEFVVFLTVKTDECIGALIERIRAEIDAHNAASDKPYALASSIGAAEIKALTTEALEAAMAAADENLYKEKMAKKSGRECSQTRRS